MRDLRLFADPALAAALEQYAVLAAVGRVVWRGLKGRAAHTREIIRMYPGQRQVQILERRGVGHSHELEEIVGADAAVAGEIKIKSGDAGRGLRDVERFGGMAQPVFQLLALGDVGDGADRPGVVPFGAEQYLSAPREPAYLAARGQGP